jgi:PAS domain S-box-containing protein
MDTVFTQGSVEDRLAVLEALYAQAPVGLAFLDRELRLRRVNEAMAALAGAAPDAHAGRALRESLGELGAQMEAAARRVLESGEPATAVPISGRLSGSRGRVRHWRVSLHPVADAAGRLRGVGAVVVETTREARATAEAESARTLLDAVFDMAPVALALWDRELRYVRINEAGALLNGVPVDAHIGRHPAEVLPGAIGERVTGLLQEVLETGEPVVGVQVSGERPGRAGELHHREASYYPLPDAGGSVVAVAGVGQDIGPRRRLEALRRQVLDREHEARLTAEAARRRAELIAAAGRALAASLDFEQTTDTVVRVAVPALADCCALHLLDHAGRPVLRAVAHADPERGGEERERLAGATPSVAEAVRTGRTVRPQGRRDALVVPVVARGRTLGTLALLSGRPFDEDDVLLAEAVADRAALALENARLHTERTRIAQTLQRSLLPPDLPLVPGVDVAAGYFPAGDENEVGGDFYDVFESEPGVWTVLIGDVAGKGAEAAALTSLARYTLRTASMLDTSPAHNLRLLNEALLSRRAGTCTVLYARLQPREQGPVLLTAASAGHPPPLVLRADGALEELTPPGTLLGAVEAPRLRARDVELGRGDLVLLYTDGATDVRTAGGILGEGPLREALAGAGGASAAEVVERVATVVREAQDGRLDDDLALLALRVG